MAIHLPADTTKFTVQGDEVKENPDPNYQDCPEDDAIAGHVVGLVRLRRIAAVLSWSIQA
jgi:hypothetical protein